MSRRSSVANSLSTNGCRLVVWVAIATSISTFVRQIPGALAQATPTTTTTTTPSPQITTASFGGQTAHAAGGSYHSSAIPMRSCVKSPWCYCDLSNLCDLKCCCDPDCEQAVTDAFYPECPCDLPNEYVVPYCSNSDIIVSNQTHLSKRPIGDLFCIIDDHVYKKETYTEGKTLTEEGFARRLKHLETLGEFVEGDAAAGGAGNEVQWSSISHSRGAREGDPIK